AGRVHEFSSPETLLDVDFAKPVYVLVDRLAVNPESRSRLVDSIEICYREGQGEAILEFIADSPGKAGERLSFNERFECKNDGTLYQEPEPRLFSFNSPFGACPRCQGFGNTIDFDMNRVIPDPTLSLDKGAVDPWNKPKYRSWLGNFKKHAPKFRMKTAICDLTEAERETLDAFIRRFFDHLETKKYKLHVRVFLSRYRGYALCPECRGARLRKEALYVR